MARRINPLIYKPMERALSRAKAKGENHYKKYLRGCASNYIKREEVRQFVFERDNYKCVSCGSDKNLQVDHIISIYKCFKDSIPLDEINCLKNLQTLCKSCNASKRP